MKSNVMMKVLSVLLLAATGVCLDAEAATRELTRLHIVGANYDESFEITNLERDWADGIPHTLQSPTGATVQARLDHEQLIVEANSFTYKLPVAMLPVRPAQSLSPELKLQLNREYRMSFKRSDTQTDVVQVNRLTVDDSAKPTS